MKEFLNQSIILSQQLKSRKFNIDNLKSSLSDIKTTDYSKEITGSNTNKNANFTNVIELIEVQEKELMKLAMKFYDVQTEIRLKILELDDVVEKEIMLARYTKFKTWEEISFKTKMSRRQIMRIHNRAIEKMHCP